MRYCIFLTLIIGNLIAIQAQEFNGGFQFGLSTSEISGDRINGPSKAGLYAGFFVNRSISKNSSLQLELNFVQKGSRKNPDTINFDSYVLRLSYLELPVLYKTVFYPRFTFEAGPSFGYLIRSYEEVNYQELDIPFEDWDVGISFGLYYKLSEQLQFNVRYFNTVFFPVRKHGSGATYWLNRGQYNEVLSFSLHYQFRKAE